MKRKKKGARLHVAIKPALKKKGTCLQDHFSRFSCMQRRQWCELREKEESMHVRFIGSVLALI